MQVHIRLIPYLSRALPSQADPTTSVASDAAPPSTSYTLAALAASALPESAQEQAALLSKLGFRFKVGSRPAPPCLLRAELQPGTL